MKINNKQEFYEALDACKDFVHEQGKDAHAVLLAVANFGEDATKTSVTLCPPLPLKWRKPIQKTRTSLR